MPLPQYFLVLVEFSVYVYHCATKNRVQINHCAAKNHVHINHCAAKNHVHINHCATKIVKIKGGVLAFVGYSRPQTLKVMQSFFLSVLGQDQRAVSYTHLRAHETA